MVTLSQAIVQVSGVSRFPFHAQGSFAHRAPAEETLKVCNLGSSSKADLLNGSLVASTLLGSAFIFIQVTRYKHQTA